MSSNLSLLVCITCLSIIYALPKGEVSDVCARPGYRATCVHSNSTNEISVCGLYRNEDCIFFCRYLVSQLTWPENPCFGGTVSPNKTLSWRATCKNTCTSAMKEILSEKNGVIKPNISAQIFLVKRPDGSLNAHSFVFEKVRRFHFEHQDLSFDFNRCSCSSCRKYGARCPPCCKYAGHNVAWCKIYLNYFAFAKKSRTWMLLLNVL